MRAIRDAVRHRPFALGVSVALLVPVLAGCLAEDLPPAEDGPHGHVDIRRWDCQMVVIAAQVPAGRVEGLVPDGFHVSDAAGFLGLPRNDTAAAVAVIALGCGHNVLAGEDLGLGATMDLLVGVRHPLDIRTQAPGHGFYHVGLITDTSQIGAVFEGHGLEVTSQPVQVAAWTRADRPQVLGEARTEGPAGFHRAEMGAVDAAPNGIAFRAYRLEGAELLYMETNLTRPDTERPVLGQGAIHLSEGSPLWPASAGHPLTGRGLASPDAAIDLRVFRTDQWRLPE